MITLFKTHNVNIKGAHITCNLESPGLQYAEDYSDSYKGERQLVEKSFPDLSKFKGGLCTPAGPIGPNGDSLSGPIGIKGHKGNVGPAGEPWQVVGGSKGLTFNIIFDQDNLVKSCKSEIIGIKSKSQSKRYYTPNGTSVRFLPPNTNNDALRAYNKVYMNSCYGVPRGGQFRFENHKDDAIDALKMWAKLIEEQRKNAQTKLL